MKKQKEMEELKALRAELEKLRKENQVLISQINNLEMDPKIIAYNQLKNNQSRIRKQISYLVEYGIPFKKVECCDHIFVSCYDKVINGVGVSEPVVSCVRCGLSSRYIHHTITDQYKAFMNYAWKNASITDNVEDIYFKEYLLDFSTFHSSYMRACELVKDGNKDEIIYYMGLILENKDVKRRKRKK